MYPRNSVNTFSVTPTTPLTTSFQVQQHLPSPSLRSLLHTPADNQIISDSGSSHILIPTRQAHLVSPDPALPPLHHPIKQPDGTLLHATTTGTTAFSPTLRLPSYIVPGLQHALGGVAPFVDHGLTVLYTHDSVCIQNGDQIVARGPRVGNLWTLPVLPALPSPQRDSPPKHDPPTPFAQNPCPFPKSKHVPTAYNMYPMPLDQRGICLFYQQCLFNPTKSTLVRAAIMGLPWKILTPEFIRKNYVDTLACAKGHLHRQKQGIQSTSPIIKPPPPSSPTIPKPSIAPPPTSDPIRNQSHRGSTYGHSRRNQQNPLLPYCHRPPYKIYPHHRHAQKAHQQRFCQGI